MAITKINKKLTCRELPGEALFRFSKLTLDYNLINTYTLSYLEDKNALNRFNLIIDFHLDTLGCFISN